MIISNKEAFEKSIKILASRQFATSIKQFAFSSKNIYQYPGCPVGVLIENNEKRQRWDSYSNSCIKNIYLNHREEYDEEFGPNVDINLLYDMQCVHDNRTSDNGEFIELRVHSPENMKHGFLCLIEDYSLQISDDIVALLK